VASNNTCDILEEARFALLTARASEQGEEAAQELNAELALQVATTVGARSLGFDTQTGALIKGAQADLAVVALNGAHQMPVYDAPNALIFASSGRDVLMTMVAGREVYAGGRVHTVDEQRLRARIEEIGRKVMGDKKQESEFRIQKSEEKKD
jgi:5-methylthioadenosine/S-adenosylhomocysteine deaminase